MDIELITKGLFTAVWILEERGHLLDFIHLLNYLPKPEHRSGKIGGLFDLRRGLIHFCSVCDFIQCGTCPPWWICRKFVAEWDFFDNILLLNLYISLCSKYLDTPKGVPQNWKKNYKHEMVPSTCILQVISSYGRWKEGKKMNAYQEFREQLHHILLENDNVESERKWVNEYRKPAICVETLEKRIRTP